MGGRRVDSVARMVGPAVAGGVAQSEVRVCAECGAMAPSERPRCGVCDTAFGPLSPLVPCPLPGRAWARVEVTLPCPACNTPMALRPESIGATLPCAHCGHAAQVDLAWWDEAFHMVHAVVDLSAPDFQGLNAPLGSFNPFAAVGVRESCIDLPCEAVPSQTPLRMRASPGAPLCQRCRSPVSVRFTAPGRLTAQCARCNDREAFSVPDVVTQRFPAVRALVAYPGDAAASVGRVEPWWVLIEGLSYMRPMIQENKSQSERANAERQAWEAWQQQERERQSLEARQRAEQAERDRAEREKRDKHERERAERERMERDVSASRDDAARERAERERLEGELRQLQEYHRAEVDRLQREAWERAEQERAHREQREAAERSQRELAAREQAAKDAKTRTRWRVAMALWALLFVAVAADLAIAFKG
jgi:hypothetical protein